MNDRYFEDDEYIEPKDTDKSYLDKFVDVFRKKKKKHPFELDDPFPINPPHPHKHPCPCDCDECTCGTFREFDKYIS